jgi:hypothetical protein
MAGLIWVGSPVMSNNHSLNSGSINPSVHERVLGLVSQNP